MPKNFCSACGSAINSKQNFCPKCGKKLNEGAADHKSANHKIPKFSYPKDARHSEIITTDDANGEPVVKFRNLHPNAVWLFYFQYLGKTSIILLLVVLAAFFEPLISIVVVVGYLAILYFLSKLSYENYEFEISSVAFRKEYGIFHKYSVNIAFEQIQNVNMRQSILDQMLGLAHLEIETAGTGGGVKKNVGGLATRSEGYIPGVAPDEALDIKTLMLTRANEQ